MKHLINLIIIAGLVAIIVDTVRGGKVYAIIYLSITLIYLILNAIEEYLEDYLYKLKQKNRSYDESEEDN